MTTPDGSDARPRPKLTTSTLFVLGAMNLIDCINVSLLTPYVDTMVSDFLDKSPADPQVLQSVGLLVALYSLAEVLFSPLWGWLADRFGRRPVLLVGLLGSAVAPVLLGLSRDLPTAFAARALDGFFCGNLGVTKTYLGEIVDETNEARGFSFLAVCFSVGLIVGPFLGGNLVNPVDWAPGVFRGTVFDTFPYLLPNLTYAVMAGISWIIGFFSLEETLRREPAPSAAGLLPSAPPTLARQFSTPKAREDWVPPLPIDPSPLSAPSSPSVDRRGCALPCAHWPRKLSLMIMSYCLISGYFSAWGQNFILITSLPRSMDGFALEPSDIGLLQNCAGVGLLLGQLILYPYFTKRFGYLPCLTAGFIVNIIVTLLFPVYGMFADPDVFGFWRYLPLAFMQAFGYLSISFCFPTMFVYINRFMEGLDRGQVNGWTNSGGALLRGLFPIFSSSMLSLGLASPIAGGRYLGVYVNAFAGLASFWLAHTCLRGEEKAAAAASASGFGTSMQPADSEPA